MHEYSTLKSISSYVGVNRPQTRHAGQSVTTFGTSNLPLQSLEGDDTTGAKVDIGDWNNCGSIEV